MRAAGHALASVATFESAEAADSDGVAFGFSARGRGADGFGFVGAERDGFPCGVVVDGEAVGAPENSLGLHHQIMVSAVAHIGEYFQASNSSIIKLILIFILFSWMTQARLVRGAVLALINQEYILAAKTMGQSDTSIILREIIPNVLSPVIVSVTLTVGQTILFESSLSFLGLGIQPPTPTWGNMLTNALEMVYSAPLLVIVPGFLIFLVVVSFNFVGDSLQDALDPKAIKR